MTLENHLGGWKFIRSNTDINNSELLVVKNRYGPMYKKWASLTKEFKSIIRNDEKIWLFTDFDYAGINDCAFAWNFIEKMEIDAVVGYDELIAESIEYWNGILPIGLSVVDDYEYYGIDKSGNYVIGRMPDSHEFRNLGDELESLLVKLRNG